jgi:hypothetical protein
VLGPPIEAYLRRLATVVFITLMLGAAAGIVAVEAWHGPVVLPLSASHGIDTGDLVAFPLMLLAVAVARRQFRRRVPGGWAPPSSAMLLGALLLLVGVVATPGGPLVPAGGATLDGTIRQTFGTRSVPVDRWSNVALTYDGATLQLYIDGDRIASRPSTAGTIQGPRHPLWIGGNRPYGEHFDGFVDEVRVYDRALTPREIEVDMRKPVHPAAGLVAAYAFDAGAGNAAADSSGHGNTGEIQGASWVAGRYGDALRFDGVRSVVRVPASPQLNLAGAMTLSGWIRPRSAQTGWRTIVQRETDAYFLTASSPRHTGAGFIDDLRAALLVAAAVWFCTVNTLFRAPAATARSKTWLVPASLFVLGSFADAALAPTGTLIGPTFVAIWLAATASSGVELAGFALAAVVGAGITFASLTGIAGVDAAISGDDDGAVARAAVLGALFMLAGLSQFALARRAHR